MSRQRSLGGLDGADGMPEEQATVESTPEEESEQAPKSFSVEKTDSRARRDFLASASCDDENATADDTVAPETNALSALPPSNTPPVLPGREACASRPADLLRGVSDNIFQDGGSLMPTDSPMCVAAAADAWTAEMEIAEMEIAPAAETPRMISDVGTLFPNDFVALGTEDSTATEQVTRTDSLQLTDSSMTLLPVSDFAKRYIAPLLEAAPEAEAETDLAIHNYEDYHKTVPHGTATLEQVLASSAGVSGWAGHIGGAEPAGGRRCGGLIKRVPEAETQKTPPGKVPGKRRPKYVPEAGPPIPKASPATRPMATSPVRSVQAVVTTLRSDVYATNALTWIEDGPVHETTNGVFADGPVRNSQARYSYSGTCKNCPSLYCTECKQFFYLDELGPDLLTSGFLPHQRNYKFTCAWCHEAGHPGECVETFQLKKQKISNAIIDAFLNMMAEQKRQDYKVAEVQHYLFAHWNTLMFGWDPLEAERHPNGEGKKHRNIAPELTKRSARAKTVVQPLLFKDGQQDTYRRLCDQRPRQPMNMLLPGERWGNTCAQLSNMPRLPPPVATSGGAQLSLLPECVSASASASPRLAPPTRKSDGLDRLDSRSKADQLKGAKQRQRMPRRPSVVLTWSRASRDLQ